MSQTTAAAKWTPARKFLAVLSFLREHFGGWPACPRPWVIGLASVGIRDDCSRQQKQSL